jgi:hypothetical protein
MNTLCANHRAIARHQLIIGCASGDIFRIRQILPSGSALDGNRFRSGVAQFGADGVKPILSG